MHAYSLQSQDRIDVDVAEFISQAALKNQEAFGKLDTMFRGRVNGFLVRACGDHWLADELTNETFMLCARTSLWAVITEATNASFSRFCSP